MPNRRRRPLQDEGRKDRKDFRQRTEQSRTQRERIETHRERRERKRETQRSRRQQVDSVRSPKEDLRTERWESRLLPVEDSFLARPVGQPSELPVVIGERWTHQAQTISTSTETTITWDTSDFTTERNGYPALWTPSTNSFRIPAGLSGIWEMQFVLAWPTDAAGTRVLYIRLNNETTGTIVGTITEGVHAFAHSQQVNTIIKLQEGDELWTRVFQSSGSPLDTIADAGYTYVTFIFLGK